MMAKITKGGSFGGAASYVMDKKKDANLIDSNGVRTKDLEAIIQSFEMQAELNPRVTKMVGHISLDFSAQDFSELKQYIYNTVMTTMFNTDRQVAGVDKLVRSCNNNLVVIYNSIDKRLAELAAWQQRENKPQVHIHKFDFSSWKTIAGFVFMSTIAFCALLAIVNLREENSSLRTNDLKYRYIKMAGDIDDRLVYDLEELIYKDKDGKVLKEMKKQIEDYERAIELKIRAEEQARFNRAASAKLDKQIKELQKK